MNEKQICNTTELQTSDLEQKIYPVIEKKATTISIRHEDAKKSDIKKLTRCP